ncbi:MlaE family ABC transporter permease [Gluconacetobacter tumulicola]|uniref:ABC transporter permease n=1 Tax=Gluconacetobacter tumulicola TaxID=1017177 RepID=A0A7W4P583_9PROT|nr:ABC transporter permease [Gluconacetobacter tumulicola]MBB2177614.1 ABC transporter permease [Gluconacetobacter tumulicola]
MTAAPVPSDAPGDSPPDSRPGWLMSILERVRPVLARVGRLTRHQVRFVLALVGAAWGVVRESVRPNSWRRTVREEFRQCLRQVVGGGLLSTMVTATLAGLMVVSQAVYWLGFAGMAQMTGSILVSVLVREISPVLVGIILLGRSGMLVLTEIGILTLGGQIRALQAQGMDPFLLLVLPRTFAFMVGGFTLGILFATISLLMGFIITHSAGVITTSVWTFFANVLMAMSSWDFLVIPLKFILVGFFVGLGACMTGLLVDADDTIATLMPRGFARGIMTVLVVNILFSMGG